MQFIKNIISQAKKLINKIAESIIDHTISAFRSSIEKDINPKLLEFEKEQKMTDREKLVKLEEAVKKMRANYIAIRDSQGGVQMFTNRDVGTMVNKDLEKLLDYMKAMETVQ